MTRPDPTAGFRRERHRGFELEVDSLEEPADAFAQSVVRGLSDRSRWLHCRWLYDDRGSAIFERICEQPEYYQTWIIVLRVFLNLIPKLDVAGSTPVARSLRPGTPGTPGGFPRAPSA